MSDSVLKFGGIPIEKSTGKKGLDPFHYQNLASKFLAECGTVYRYHQRRVLSYTGTHYFEEEELDLRLRQFLLRSNISHNNQMVGNITPFIKTATYLDTQVHQEMPFWLGKELTNPRKTIAFRNGLLDVEKAVTDGGISTALIKHQQNWFSLNCLPYDFDPKAECPLWLRFLDQTFEGDQERISILQEFAGYLLLPDTSRQKMLAMLGVSRAGKGTISKILQALLGDGNWTAYDLSKMASSYGMTSLVGRLAAFVGEVNLQKHNDKYRILSALNMVTGCDPVEVEWKYEKVKPSILLPTRFVISCNAFPNFSDPSGALAERTLVLNFRKALPEDQRDKSLADKLKTEITGICNWAIAGLIRLNAQDGFTRSAISNESLKKIRRNASPVVAFAQDRLKVSPNIDTGNLADIEIDRTGEYLKVMKLSLSEAYCEWASNYDGEVNTAYLRRDLELIFPAIKEKRESYGKRPFYYEGIALKPY